MQRRKRTVQRKKQLTLGKRLQYFFLDMLQTFFVTFFSMIFSFYFLGVVVFYFYNPPQTFLRDWDISFRPVGQIIEEPVEKVIKLHSRLDSGIKLINMTPFKLRNIYAPSSSANVFMWPFSQLKRTDLSYSVTLDWDQEAYKQTLLSLMQELNKDLPENPQDAEMKLVSGEMQVKKEVYGKIPQNAFDSLDARFREAISKREADPTVTVLDLYASPKHTINGLEKELQKLINFTIKIPELKITLKGAELYRLMNDDYTANLKAVSDYAWDLSNEYDTYDSYRKFKTAKGKEIEVEPGIYGWRMNVDETIQRIATAINSHKDADVEIAYQKKARARGKSDLGDRYIEISLADQHLWLIDKGKILFDTDITSGNPNLGWDTHKGVHEVWSKESDATLVGADYRVPVKYWMPFNWEGEGMHSANRSAFGSSVYQENGSHGCINMRLNDVEKVYNMVEVGTPVVIY